VSLNVVAHQERDAEGCDPKEYEIIKEIPNDRFMAR